MLGTITAEHLEPHSTFKLGSHLMVADDIVSFAAQWDPLPMHTDVVAAESSAYGTLIASGLHTLAVYQRLAVLAVFSHWKVFAGRRIVDAKLLRPVRAGDTLRGTLTIESVRFTHPARALVTTLGVLTVGSERALEVTVEAYVYRDEPHGR